MALISFTRDTNQQERFVCAVTKRNEEIDTFKFGRYLDVFIYFIVLFYIIKLTSNSPPNFTNLVMFLFNLFMPNDLPF